MRCAFQIPCHILPVKRPAWALLLRVRSLFISVRTGTIISGSS
ncbi:hypothetical protein BN1183_AA_01360 [Pantoea ananatis]|nr:hypothetical protein BN1183_AA_01360 [Pantoea ananatis]